MDYTLHPLSDQTVAIEFPQKIDRAIHMKIRQIGLLLDDKQPKWLIEYVPAFASIAIHYDVKMLNLQTPNDLPYDIVTTELTNILQELNEIEVEAPRTVKIPVFYGGSTGPDLEEVAKHNGKTPNEVIDIHTNGEYTVYMLGFAPGFPYMGGMSTDIATPRKNKPRLAIPAGSVGIAGEQTGIYPIETPGGWQIIGQTPLALFNPENEEAPTLLQAGDQIRFYAITEEEFHNWKENGK
ncbi:5-oxoprolinase subunit PxpB [Jeotgalibacillus soli]|uniref:Allophanate hydrolase subunit 1 n=1 Tax=Jeotgalibacillus soli TaxID=889306 RepID=A0A0C2VKN1_9BACL|nr:5-oxoprolinase subunit PxpB [Jeotgalibacillus soli]KIL49462.1 allophanate hydrolase subunit 1 [Jeotgalibacillus soli]